MAEIDIDTDKLKEITKEFYSASKQVDTIINSVFDLIDSLPKKDIWVGPNAERFINLTMSERMNAKAFVNSLYSYANFLNNVSDKYNNMYTSYRRDDENIH